MARNQSLIIDVLLDAFGITKTQLCFPSEFWRDVLLDAFGYYKNSATFS